MIKTKWRPLGWTDAYESVRKKNLQFASTSDAYELGADNMLLSISSLLEQKTGKKLEELINEYL